MTTIVDYGAGNLRSVQNTLDELGGTYEVTSDPAVVSGAEKIILPGVGHFGQMMRAMDELRLRQPVIERIRAGVPFLGICIGLQCLFESSEESPSSSGLNIFPGRIRRFSGSARIPHMGWNSLESVHSGADHRFSWSAGGKTSRLLAGLQEGAFTYFAHSYYAPVIDATAATCLYMQPYTAVLEQDNVYAVQFHPEKSGPVGLRVMKNFLDL